MHMSSIESDCLGTDDDHIYTQHIGKQSNTNQTSHIHGTNEYVFEN